MDNKKKVVFFNTGDFARCDWVNWVAGGSSEKGIIAKPEGKHGLKRGVNNKEK